VAVEDLDAERVGGVRADADLDRAVGIDDTFIDGATDERTMVDALAVVRPGVLMGVELHQRQRPVDGGMRLEQRPGDEMVAAERQQESA